MNVYIFESWHDVPFQVDDWRANKSSNDPFQLPVNVGDLVADQKSILTKMIAISDTSVFRLMRLINFNEIKN